MSPLAASARAANTFSSSECHSTSPVLWARSARNSGPVPDEHHHGQLPNPDAVPAGALVDLAVLVVDPHTWGQVDVAARRVLHERGNEDVSAGEVLTSSMSQDVGSSGYSKNRVRSMR